RRPTPSGAAPRPSLGPRSFWLAGPWLRSCAESSFTLRRGQGYGAVVTKVVGASWAVEVTYACRCGVHYRATRWRWIDAEAMADEAERTRREGPLRGRCPSCSAPATGQTDWLELKPSKQHCVLILAANQRHAVAELMRDHFTAVVERVGAGDVAIAEPWLLRPLWRFDDETGTVVVRAAAVASDD